jgi:hypothetical protein
VIGVVRGRLRKIALVLTMGDAGMAGEPRHGSSMQRERQQGCNGNQESD